MKGDSRPFPLPTPHSHSQEAVSLASSFSLFFSSTKVVQLHCREVGGGASRLNKGLGRNCHRWAGLPGPAPVWKAGEDQHPVPFSPSWGRGRKQPFSVFPRVSNRVSTLCSELRQTFLLGRSCQTQLASLLSAWLTALELPSQVTSTENSCFSMTVDVVVAAATS